MISDVMAERLNQQLNEEFFAFYKYTAMSAYCSSISLNGFAHWFALQASEEQAHAMKFYNYLLEQDRNVVLLPLKQPKNNFESIVEVIELSLQSEQHVTKCINELMGLALKESDFATNAFLQWFITEQVEEEATVRDILDRVKMVKDSSEGLLHLDREVSSRSPEEAQ